MFLQNNTLNYSFFLPSFKLILFIIFFALPQLSRAQLNANSIELNFQKSMSIFSAQLPKLVGNVYGTEVIYHLNTNKNPRKWSKDSKVKSIDFIFNYKSISNLSQIKNPIKNTLGDSYGFLAGITCPLLNINKVSVDFSPALGIVYTGESWFSNQMPYLGSKLNFGAKGGLKVSFNATEKTKIAANLDLLHFSNGGLSIPNNGLNIVSTGISITRFLNDTLSNNKLAFYKDNYKKNTFDFGFIIGRRGVSYSKNGLLKTGLYGGYNYRLNSYLALGTGIDATYYHTLYDPNNHASTFQSMASSFDRWRVGAAVGPDLWLGKLGIMLKYGYYLYFKSYNPVKTYYTVGVRYKLNNWLSLQTKAQINTPTEADFTGFGLIFTK